MRQTVGCPGREGITRLFSFAQGTEGNRQRDGAVMLRQRRLEVRLGPCVTNAPSEYDGAELYER